MRVWQIRDVLLLCLVAFVGACDRSPDHASTFLLLLAACMCDRAHNIAIITLSLQLQLCSSAKDSSSSNAARQ